MQVSVEVTSDLSRNMKVVVPEDKIQEQVESRLKSMAHKVKIDGFRPGKVPASVVRKQYGQQVRQEVIGDLIQSSFYEGIRQQDLNPAGAPEIRAVKFEEGEGLEYVAGFEVLPEFVVMPIETLEVKEFLSEIGEADVGRVIDQLLEQRKTWHEVERSSQNGDQVLITFEGTQDGENFTQGKTENLPVVLGSGRMIPGFEDQLLGHKAGDQFEFDITFPENYQGPNLAGKNAHFSVEVVRVEEASVPAMDESLVKSYGVASGSFDEFKTDIHANMEREMRRALKGRTKASVMDQLFERNPIQLPEVLLREEIQELMKPYEESARKHKRTLDESALKEQLMPLAKRRVSLALILGKVIEAHNIKSDPSRIRAAVHDLASAYEDASEVVRWYYADPSRLKEIENMVMEDQIIDLILEKAKKASETIPFETLMQASSAPAPIV